MCGWCGEKAHTERDVRCPAPSAKCRHCAGSHPSWDKRCGVYVYEKEVLYIKETQNVSYKRAKGILDERSAPQNNFASVFADPEKRVPTYKETMDKQNQNMLLQLLEASIMQAINVINEKLAHLSSVVATLASTEVKAPQQFKYSDATEEYVAKQIQPDNTATSDQPTDMETEDKIEPESTGENDSRSAPRGRDGSDDNPAHPKKIQKTESKGPKQLPKSVPPDKGIAQTKSGTH